MGKSNISWSTNGNLGEVKVFVSQDGSPETLFASGPEGTQEAPWIVTGSTYEFRLYAGTGSNRKLIDKVLVTPSSQ